MIILRKTGPYLLMLVDDNIIMYNFQDGNRKIVKIQEPPVQSNVTKSLEEVLKPENRRITSVCASKNAEYLAVTLQNRQLVIYDIYFNVIKSIMTNRAVSKARFTNQNDVLVADKTGDVYLYKFKTKEQPELLLGHLSMLLDVTLSECGKYVITCDRDEKIRVSRYPNAYNIVSYCLGHREFVNSLEVSGDTLISASGDGTIRFWNFLSGKQLSVVNTNEYIKDKSVVEKFCREMDDEKVDISAVPIIDMQVYQNIVGVTLLGFNGVQLYRMELCDGSLNVKFLKYLEVRSEVISFSLNQELFILTKDELLVYKISAKVYESVNSEEITKFYENCKSTLSQSNHVTSSISALYKRKFDNVQEYLEKKRLRLENKS